MEIELKYRIPDNQTAEILHTMQFIGRLTVSTGRLVVMHDSYYDTEDGLLRNAGLALRIRNIDKIKKLSLKSLTPAIGHLHQREELEIPVPGITDNKPESWPDTELKDRIWRITGGQKLELIFELHQYRTLRNITKNNLCIAEMCIDDTRCNKGTAEYTYKGLEIELKGTGTKQVLKRISNQLEKKFDLIPENRSKYELALAFTMVPPVLLIEEEQFERPPPVVFPMDTIRIAALRTFCYHFDIMKQNEAGAFRGEDIEYIHDMRVAVRRMLTAYRIFKPYLDADIRPYQKTLKKTGRILGMVRDMDVFRENYASYTNQNKTNSAITTVSKAWNIAYISIRNQLLNYLSSTRFLGFKTAFSSYLQSTALEPDDTPLVATQLRNTIMERQQKCVSQYQEISHLQQVPLFYYHQLRIYLKHFRYCIEYFRSVLGEAGEETIEETKVVQDHLGMLQDAVVARNHLYTVLHWGSWFSPQQPYTLIPVIQNKERDTAEYLAHIETSIQQLTTSFPSVWEQFTAFLSKNRLNLPLINVENTL